MTNLELVNLIKRLVETLPNKRTDYSGVGWCAGCGAVLYVSGDSSPRDPCKSDCVLNEALKVVKNAPLEEEG